MERPAFLRNAANRNSLLAVVPPESPLGPRDHMALLVDLPDGRWLADVGFGACLMVEPRLVRKS